MPTDIIQLSDRDHIRGSKTGAPRLQMTLGSIGEEDNCLNPESLVCAIREVIDNSKDAIIENGGTEIKVFIDKKAKEPLGLTEYEGKDNTFCKKWWRYTISDDSSGFPIKATKDLKGEEISQVQLALENFRTGSKFIKGENAHFVGLHGIGAAATNFTSAEFICYSRLNLHKLSTTTEEIKKLIKANKITIQNIIGKYLKIVWNLGIRKSIEIVDKDEDEILSKYYPDYYPSTVTSFIPDPTLHRSTCAEVNDGIFKYFGYVYPKVNFFIDGKKVNTKIGFKYSDSVTIASEKPNSLNKNIKIDYSIEPSKSFNKYKQEFSVNTLECKNGKHVRIYETAWSKALCDYFGNSDIEKYATMGVNVLFILQCSEPQFSSQTKERLTTIDGFETTKPLDKLVKSFTKIIKANEAEFRKVFDNIISFYSAKQTIGMLKELKKQIGDLANGTNRSTSAFLPKKLLDCTCKDRKRANVFFCEGNSASGGFVKARAGMDNIAIMPLRGKILNTIGLDTSKALENKEIYDITHICGGVNEMHVDLEKLHYGQYNIATDADSDGYQIAALLLGNLLQNHKYLFGTEENNYEDSKVFIIISPLYAFGGVDGKKQDKYFYVGEEAKVAEFQKKHTYKTFKRFKGLGELNKEELKTFYLDEKTRRQIQIRPDNIDEALSLVSDTEERKAFMLSEGIITLDTIKL